MKKIKKYRFNMGAASAPGDYEHSLKINRALNDGFREEFDVGRRYFSDIFSELCCKYHLKDNTYDIYLTIYDKNTFYKNNGYGRVGDCYYFESKPIMRRVPYFEYSKLIDMHDVLLKCVNRNHLLIYLSELACTAIREIAVQEGWNAEAVDCIRRDILVFISNPNKTG